MSESAWATTPPTESVAMLKKQIAGYVLMPTDPEVLETAEAGIRRAIDRLNTRTWGWSLTYDDIDFLADTPDYGLSSQFKSPRHLELWNSDGRCVGSLGFKEWKTFLMEHQNRVGSSQPCIYSCSNVHDVGLMSLDVYPTAEWVATYPAARIWYFRRTAYPGSDGAPVNVPSEVAAFIQSEAEGYTADRYAVLKAQPAYQRAERFLHELVVDDRHGGSTDWE